MTSSAFKLILFRRITSKIIILSALCYRYFLVSIVSLLHLKNTKDGINKVKEAKVKQAEHHTEEFFFCWTELQDVKGFKCSRQLVLLWLQLVNLWARLLNWIFEIRHLIIETLSSDYSWLLDWLFTWLHTNSNVILRWKQGMVSCILLYRYLFIGMVLTLVINNLFALISF